jgi:hypothetical protein
MKSKTAMIREALGTGNQIAALRLAAHFHDHSTATKTYKRGFDALNNPRFYRQIGRDPECITAAAIALLIRKFG